MLLLGYLAIFGLKFSDKTIIKGAKDINTGLDISGGVTITYQAEVEDGKEITQEDLDKSKAVIQKRLEAMNIYDYIIIFFGNSQVNGLILLSIITLNCVGNKIVNNLY